MGLATGAKSKLLLGVETAWGSPAELKHQIPFTSESLNYIVEALRSGAILNTRGTKAVAPGQEGVAGSIEAELFPETTGVLFYLALGKATAEDPDETPSSGDEYTKIVPAGINEDLPSATVRVNHGGVKTLDYTGLRINQLSFEGAVGSIPKITADLIGKTEGEDLATENIQNAPGDEPFFFKELTLSKDGNNFNVATYSDIRFSINNNLSEDDYVLDGTGQRIDVAAGELQLTGSATLLFNADVMSDEYAKFKSWTTFSLWIKLEKGTSKFVIYLPKVQITELTHDIGGKEKISVGINFEALEDASDGVIVVEDYVNTTATY